VSQCKQILQVLSDGREHEMRDIHQAVGFCRLNSRIAELRSRGNQITCRRDGASYFYKLEATGSPSPLASTGAPASNPAPLEAAASTSGRDGAGAFTLFGEAA